MLFPAIHGAAAQFPGCLKYGVHDGLITSTAANVAGYGFANFFPRRHGVLFEKRPGRHEKAGRTETALQRVSILKRTLQRMEFISIGQAFHGMKISAVGLDRKQKTGTHGFAVHKNRASAANSMFTAEMGAGEIQILADKVRKRHSSFNESFVSSPVDCDFNHLLAAQWTTLPSDRASADSSTRRAKTPPTSFRYAAEA